jgi:diguanylate cyclase
MIADSLLETTTRSMQQNRLMQDHLQQVEQKTQQLQTEVTKLRNEAATDPLTGLYNRKALNQRMESLLETTQEKQRAPFCVLMLDIDHFKRFNDQFGHIIGDEVIRRVGVAMKELVREQDFPARFGGEEFTVVLPATPMSDAVKIAQTINQAVAKLTLVRRSTKERLPNITISVGAAEARHEDSCETLLERADQALYLAKEGGRNRVATEEEINYM